MSGDGGQADIIVVGGGPAGCVAARGLAALGYEVVLVSVPRNGDECEGIGARVLTALRRAGFERALAAVSPLVVRTVAWNDQCQQANREHIVQRQSFDSGLLADLEAFGVRVLRARADRWRCDGGRWLVSCRGDQGVIPLGAGFLVDARGRAGSGKAARSPSSVSFGQWWRCTADSEGTAVSALPEGWLWTANSGDGRLFSQLTIDSVASVVPGRAGIDAGLEKMREPLLAELGASAPLGPWRARAASAMLHREPVGVGIIRIGDAAMTVDPLSGGGMFQSLSSALIAPAVINTILARPQSGSLARRFYRERVTALFYRYARLGRDFYRMENRWVESRFWSGRRCWPDDEPLHCDDCNATVRPRPVIYNDFIELRDVVVTSDQPLGIWQVAGVELAPLMRALMAEGWAGVEQALSGLDETRQRALRIWLGRHATGALSI